MLVSQDNTAMTMNVPNIHINARMDVTSAQYP